MLKEIKYLFFLASIALFIFFILKYYFSDSNKKNSYRLFKNINQRLESYSEKLPYLEDDTKDIIEFVEQTNSKKKKYKFWKLLEPNE